MYSNYAHIKSILQKYTIDPILYGSLGVSVYLGNFKQFNDIDLLIEDKWLENQWEDLKEIMNENGFYITDEKEHEFENEDKVKVAFAKYSILIKDKICQPKDAILVEKEGTEIRTLTVKDFLKAYQFSVKDGYRTESRGQRDQEIIDKLVKIT
jgi:hypothetical protein